MDRKRKSDARRIPAVLVTLLFLLPAAGCGPGEDPAEPPPAPPPVGDPPPPRLLGRVPLAVEGLPAGVTPEQGRPFFDTYSWQMFLALNWPALRSKRGAPESPGDDKVFRFSPAGAPEVVWGSYKADFELFGQGDERPTEWGSRHVKVDPCGTGSGETKTLVRVTKGDSLTEAGGEAFTYPLIDQSRNYALYEVRFNERYYDFVRGRDDDPATWLYEAEKLAARKDAPGGVQMPAGAPPDSEGAIMVQAAWKVLDPDRDDLARFYAVDAQVYDPQTRRCTPRRVGLVGLHVVHKLADFPEWIWASFEQVDNVPSGEALPGRIHSFNNGTTTPATEGGYADRPPETASHLHRPLGGRGGGLQPENERTPVQVTRFNPIPESTQEVNGAWRELLYGTVWVNYQLVVSQWPSEPGRFRSIEGGGEYPRDAGAAFPAEGATNPVMETYFQSPEDAREAGGNSCLSCHYRAGLSDFSWTLERRAR